MIVSVVECPDHGRQGIVRVHPPEGAGLWRWDVWFDNGIVLAALGDFLALCLECDEELQFWMTN